MSVDSWLETLVLPEELLLEEPWKNAFDPTSGNSSDSSSISYRSGKASPMGQIMTLADQNFVFRCFDEAIEEGDVLDMYRALQELADGIGIIGYDIVPTAFGPDTRRLMRPDVSNEGRLKLGQMPTVNKITRLVAISRSKNLITSEQEWTEDVHVLFLEMAMETSTHQNMIKKRGVRTSKVAKELAFDGLPRRTVDYALTLIPDVKMKESFEKLTPIYGERNRSWNHIPDVTDPIAIHIETKSMMTSWTNGVPQMAIWINSFIARLRLLKDDLRPPPIPVLIAQGPDWYLLIITHRDGAVLVRDKLDIGGTRDHYEACKLIAVLHWVMDWAQTIWRPWFEKSFMNVTIQSDNSV